MTKRNKTMTLIKYITILAGILALFCYFIRINGRTEHGTGGLPDALNSVVSGKTCSLTVVANTNRIDDKEMFAREVIQMCRDNSFSSLRLSTDVGGWPKELDITVYYYRRDIGKRDPAMRILYKPVNDNEKISIKDADQDKYILNIE